MSENINYNAIFEAFESQKPVTATVIESTGRDFIVDLFGMKTFLPGSETKDKENVKEGDSINVIVLKINPSKSNVVVSNRVYVEQKERALAQETISEMHIGDIVQGVVKSLVNYGAFISLGKNVDGLVALKELSWKKVFDVNSVLSVGDVVDVKIIDIEEKLDGTKKVVLSIKQCTSDPWSIAKTEDYIDRVFDCTITHVASYGLFVDTGELDGLIHVSEMSWSSGKKIIRSEMYSVGDKVKAKVILCDFENHKVNLSIKAVLPDPWDAVSEEMIGKDVEVTVNDVASFGLFVETIHNVNGLIHINDLSWAKDVYAADIANKGDKLMARIIGLDKAKHQMVLSRKVLINNPWEKMNPLQYVGRIFEGKVVKVKKNAVLVMITPDLIGRLRDGEIEPDSVKRGDVLKVTPDYVDIPKQAVFLKVAH